MKKLILILGIAMLALTSCKKDDIKPNVEPYIENIDENIDEGNDAHISDSMIYVHIVVKSQKVTTSLKVRHANKNYIVYVMGSQDSSVYVSNGWKDFGYGLGTSWSGWIKPESLVTLSGIFKGGANNVFNFEVRVQVNNGTPFTKNFNITTSNKKYSTAFTVN